MPGVNHNNHGQSSANNHGQAPAGGDGLAGTTFTKNFISDNTWKYISSDLSLSTNWALDAIEGLGTAAQKASTVGHILAHGYQNDIEVTSEWKFISQAGNASYGVIGRMRTYIGPDDGYYWMRIYDGDELRFTKNNGGTTTIDSQALGQALVQDEIHQIIHKITDSTGVQTHLGTFKGQGRTDNAPGAATYNLSGIAAGADTTISIALDGGSASTVTFQAGDFVDYANCTNAEVAAIINNTPNLRCWVVGNAMYIATDTFGASGSINLQPGSVNDANAVLGFTTGAQAGDEQTVGGDDATLDNFGFVGFRGGFSANTAHWLREISIAYLT